MTKRAKLLWIDLEMTGLSPIDDRIMEVGVIATDWDFREFATYEAVQRVNPDLMKKRMTGEFWETYPDVRDALQAQNEQGRASAVIEQELLSFINENFPAEERILLAGNSIHQDRRFIENEWPQLDVRLHYRMLDVSAWKVVMDGKYKKRFVKPEAHRAMEDIRGSIQELQYYLGKIRP